jgi:hypothetical protein
MVYALQQMPRLIPQRGLGMAGERRVQNGASYYGDNHTTAGRWLDK